MANNEDYHERISSKQTLRTVRRRQSLGMIWGSTSVLVVFTYLPM